MKPVDRLQIPFSSSSPLFSFSWCILLILVVLWLCHQGKPPDWQDFVGIITLLVINSTISFIEENNAGNAAAALMARLAPKAKVRYRPLYAVSGYVLHEDCVY